MSFLSASATAAALFLLYTNLPVVVAQKELIPPVASYLVPALLLGAVVLQVVIRRRAIVLDRTLLVMMAFLAVLLVSSFAAEGQSVAVSRIGTFLGEGILIYFLVRNAVRSLPEVRVAVGAILAAACVLAGLTVIQAFTGDYEQDFLGLAQRSLELSDGQPTAAGAEIGLEDRARGPVDEPNRFAQILLMVAPLAVVFGLNALRRRTAMIAWAGVGLLLAAVLLTYSRGALLTIVVLGIVAVPLRLVRPGRLVAALAIGGVLTVATIPGLAHRVASIAGVAGLFGESKVEPDGPIRGRTTEMLAALAAYTDHPVLGVGPGQYYAYHSVRYQAMPEISIRDIPIPRRAHSLFLEVAAETGTVGLLVFMAIPLLLLADLGRLRRGHLLERPDLARLAAGFTLALLAYLGTGVFLHLAFERYYWAMVALTASVVGMLEQVPTRVPVDVLDPMEARAWA
jgi:hypothetical protein